MQKASIARRKVKERGESGQTTRVTTYVFRIWAFSL
jgi:hypothetical protein